MTRPRPYIPLDIRRRVAERQFGQLHAYGSPVANEYIVRLLTVGDTKANIAWLLEKIGMVGAQLDHNPALILRPYKPHIKDPAARYTPNANDPNHLEYRPQAADAPRSHHIKTNVRGDGALRSDTSERVYRRKVERNKVKRKAIKIAKAKGTLRAGMIMTVDGKRIRLGPTIKGAATVKGRSAWPSRPFPKRGKP